MEQATGAYYGIGAYVAQDVERNYPKINSPIPGSPAEEVGMRPDDIIYEVDGVSTYGMDLDKVVSLIKGEEGTTVNITLYRKGNIWMWKYSAGRWRFPRWSRRCWETAWPIFESSSLTM